MKMKKEFNKDSILSVGDYFVVVDKKAEYKRLDWIYSYGEVWQYKPSLQAVTEEDFYKIIATIGKRIGDIPLIELPDGVDGLAKDFADRLKMLAPIQENEWLNARDHFKFGYEANKGKYSEEDMRKAYNLGAANQTLTMAKFPIKQQFLDLLKSLQTKRPIKIVLEYEDLTEDNTIKPLEVEYE